MRSEQDMFNIKQDIFKIKQDIFKIKPDMFKIIQDIFEIWTRHARIASVLICSCTRKTTQKQDIHNNHAYNKSTDPSESAFWYSTKCWENQYMLKITEGILRNDMLQVSYTRWNNGKSRYARMTIIVAFIFSNQYSYTWLNNFEQKHA